MYLLVFDKCTKFELNLLIQRESNSSLKESVTNITGKANIKTCLGFKEKTGKNSKTISVNEVRDPVVERDPIPERFQNYFIISYLVLHGILRRYIFQNLTRPSIILKNK